MAQSKVFIGVIWASVQRFGTMIISFVANIVLARLLTPDDYGTVGMLMFFLAIASTFVDSGFGSALIQKKDATDRDCSTVFVINLVMSSLLYAILFLCAPLISRFYGIPILSKILRIQGLTLFINAFAIIQTTILRKQLNFKKLSIANIVGNIGGTIIAIVMALLGCGLWSLVARGLSVSLIVTIVLWVVSDWKASLFFDRQSFKELFGFGGFILLSSVITTISNNVQTLIIGKIFSPKDLGNYTQARTLRNVCSESISSVIAQVLYPDFSNYQNDNVYINEKLNNAVYIISYAVSSIMMLCILLAEPLILLIYGEKWYDCIPFFRIACCGGVFIALQDVNYYVTAAKGKSKPLFFFNLCKVIVYIVILSVGGKMWGLYGLLWAIVIYVFVAYLFYSQLATHYLKTSAFKQYKNIFHSILICVCSGGICYGIMWLLPSLNPVLMILIVGFAYWIILFVSSRWLRLFPFMYIRNSSKPMIDRLFHKSER